MGFINMQTAEGDSLPAENVSALRLRRQLFNEYSNVGGILTSRIGNDGHYNFVYGLDGIVRPFADEYVTVKWAQSLDHSDESVDPLQTGRLLIEWERRQQDGFGYLTTFSWAAENFDPGIGFENRTNFKFMENRLHYQKFLNGDSKLRLYRLSNGASAFIRNSDSRVESASWRPSLRLETKTGMNMRLLYKHSYEDVNESFSLTDDVEVPTGTYWFLEAELELRASRGSLVRPNLTIGGGSFYDGWKASVRSSPSWTVSSHLQFEGAYELNLVRFGNRSERFDAHIGRIRMQAAFNGHLSINTFFQYSNIAELVSINACLRYHFNEGSDLWFVYDEGLNTVRDQIDAPRRPVMNNRALLLKYTYTFIR
jgi:hypothetical protein